MLHATYEVDKPTYVISEIKKRLRKIQTKKSQLPYLYGPAHVIEGQCLADVGQVTVDLVPL